jgi:hypothetical protein
VFSVVKTLDVIEHISLGFVACQVSSAIYTFSFQQAEEAFNNGIVVTVASCAHAALDTVLLEFIAEIIACILGAAIRVV